MASASLKTTWLLRIGRFALPALLAASGAALANPDGLQVVSGQATAVSQGGTLSVTNSPGAILHWQDFSIGAGETTRFIQQSASSSVLNRVVGQDPTQILGALQSNGRVFLINPNGILFGPGAQVDVHGLAASTLDIADRDFLAGRLQFRAGADAGVLRNHGTITTPAGGRIALIATDVRNSGIIAAPDGEVLLAAGHSVRLADTADPNLEVVLSAPGQQAVNLGRILAQGGRVGIFGALAGQGGTVEAERAVRGENGNIVLLSGAATVAATPPTPAQCRLAPATPGCIAVLRSVSSGAAQLVTQLLNVKINPVRRTPVLIIRADGTSTSDAAARDDYGCAVQPAAGGIDCVLR